MRVLGVPLVLATVALLPAPATAMSPPPYYFTIGTGLRGAAIGGPLSAFSQLFESARKLAPRHYKPCTELHFGVSSQAARSGVPDLLIVYCDPSDRVTEVHLPSGAFCTARGTCVGTRGSLHKLANEMGAGARLISSECEQVGGGCKVVESRRGRIVVDVRTDNCNGIRSLGIGSIPDRCIASEVLVYLTP